MSRKNEEEKEIVLGNGQLLGIFLAGAVLLGVAFAGGYMIGKGKRDKAPVATAAIAQPTQTASANAPIGETHSIPAETGTSGVPSGSTGANSSDGQTGTAAGLTRNLPPEVHAQVHAEESAGAFAPEHGERFLQVAAVTRDEAYAVSDVLRKKGFRAHAVQKPGSEIYRVLIGPIRNKADFSATRDALRRTGFSEVITQRY